MKVNNIYHNIKGNTKRFQKEKSPSNNKGKVDGQRLWVALIEKGRKKEALLQRDKKDNNESSQIGKLTKKKDSSEEPVEERQRKEGNIQSPNFVIPPIDNSTLLNISARLVKDIYSGINSSGNREILVTLAPALFNNTSVRIERVGRGRIRLVVNTKDPAAFGFFNMFYENIRAGLLMKGITIDEFRFG